MAGQALTAGTFADLPVFRGRELRPAPGASTWEFDNLVGVLSELSEETSAGAVSFAAEIIAQAQAEREPVAWVAGTDSVFYPPDLAERGVDLDAVIVIRAGAQEGTLTAAEWLVRSAAFGLVIVDAGSGWKVNDAALGRILKLAEAGLCAVVFLTRKGPEDPSLGSRISLRACVARSGSGPFHVSVRTIKDKRSNAGSRQGRLYHGPSGMH